jgi:hypothetical protein
MQWTKLLSEFEMYFAENYQNNKHFCYFLSPGANVIKLFAAVIYCHSMVIPSFCVIKLYYFGNYHGMAVNYHSIKLFYNIGQKSLHLSVKLKIPW